jgi:hypothetical protein
MLNGILMVGFLPQAWLESTSDVSSVCGCVVCGSPVDWDIVKEDFKDLLNQVDCHGPDSLTENEQVVYEGRCCSQKCFDKLN